MAESGWSKAAPRRSPAPTHDFTDASRGERLQKVLAAAGVASRRACETLIRDGEVTVNGHVVRELPAWVDPKRDRVAVSGVRMRTNEPAVYVMLHKPRGVVCTNTDPAGRKRAVDLVRHPSGVRLFPVGRLDVESSGLLLLTNDGLLANRLAHPRYGVHKTYEVTVAGQLDEAAVAKLARGVFLAERRRGAGARAEAGARQEVGARRAPASRIKLLRRERDRTHLLIELHEGRNRQVRRMLLQVGHKVKRLRRVALGPIKLVHVRPGGWRELAPDELKALRKAAGLA